MDKPQHKKGKYFTMDSKKVHALLLAIERGSLTSAAAELGYTQSGLTHMMNSLEQELGLNLLVRSKNGVRLSPAGLALKSKMRAFLDAYAVESNISPSEMTRLASLAVECALRNSKIELRISPEILKSVIDKDRNL